MKKLYLSLAITAGLFAQSPTLGSVLKNLAFANQASEARALLEQQRVNHDPSSASWLAAVSWVARGASFVEQWDVAQKYASEAYRGSEKLIAKGAKIESSTDLETALGASIEVLGKAYFAAGDRAKASEFLHAARETYRGTPVQTRIQKNYLLVSLEGKPMPELEASSFIGKSAPIELDGKVGLFYFWAHWCSDCKAQKPALQRLHDEFAAKGLEIVGPTRLYGYDGTGRDVTPGQEESYLQGPYQSRNPLPPWMPAPLSTANFVNFGVSSTPTLVVTDRQGIVRLYHPGEMPYAELRKVISPLI